MTSFLYGIIVAAPLGAFGTLYVMRFVAIRWPDRFDAIVKALRGA